MKAGEKPMKILVTGATGQLGSDVCAALRAREMEHRGVGSAALDITDAGAVQQYMNVFRPDAVIHCAAWTAVDGAEEHPEEARRVNVDGTRNLAAACRAVGARMLYVSTDYVFPGTGTEFYRPDALTGPLNVYGRTKLEGENAVRALLEHYFIVRTSWVFGVHGANFVKTMLRLGETHESLRVVCDQMGSPTYTADLAPLLYDMVMTENYGVYHATNEGICSWAEFAKEIFRFSGMNVTVNPVSSSEYPSRAARPLNSRLSKDKLEQAGFYRLPDWRDALGRCLKEIRETA